MLRRVMQGGLSYYWNYSLLLLRVWLFETFPTLYRYLFGTL
jgi:hypothetical protein